MLSPCQPLYLSNRTLSPHTRQLFKTEGVSKCEIWRLFLCMCGYMCIRALMCVCVCVCVLCTYTHLCVCVCISVFLIVLELFLLSYTAHGGLCMSRKRFFFFLLSLFPYFLASSIFSLPLFFYTPKADRKRINKEMKRERSVRLSAHPLQSPPLGLAAVPVTRPDI